MVRELGVHEVPLSTLKDAAHMAGGTLNDAFIAGVTGGLRSASATTRTRSAATGSR